MCILHTHTLNAKFYKVIQEGIIPLQGTGDMIASRTGIEPYFIIIVILAAPATEFLIRTS